MNDAQKPRRLLFVHAHPDDETLATGLAMADAVAAGHEVHVLTCTLGDEGEVIPADLRHLAVDRDDALGAYRRGELRRAMSRIGVQEAVLGEDPRSRTGAAYRDSGMAGTGANADSRSLCRAPLTQVTEAVRSHIRALDPDVVVTYDQHGGYEHPDHIRVHQVTCAAIEQLAPTSRPPLFAALTPRSWAVEDRQWLAEHVPESAPVSVPEPDAPWPASVVADHVVTHHVVPSQMAIAARDAALREHVTQVTVFDGFYALSNNIAARLTTREGYAELDSSTGLPLAASGAERIDGFGLAGHGGRT